MTVRMQCLLSGLALMLGMTGASADEPEVKGRVVGKVWHSKVNMSDSFQFMQSVRAAAGIEQSGIVMMMPSAASRIAGPMMSFSSDRDEEVSTELKGTVFFLQTEPEPSLDGTFAFTWVGSHEEFMKRVRQQQERMGSAAELIGDEDRYEVKLRLQRLMTAPPVPPSDTEAEEGGERRVQTFSVVIQADVRESADGPPGALRTPPDSISTYFRYVDGIMYASRLPILHQVDLPTQDQLQLDQTEAQNDLHADFDLSEIPIHLKRAFWNALEASAATWLQRFDNEEIGAYSLRRSLGEGRLELIRAGLFDVERVRFSLKLPEEGEHNVRASLRVTARDESRLAQTLSRLGQQPTQLAALQDDAAAMSFSTSLKIPEWSVPATTMIVESLRLRLREAADDDGSLGVLIDDMMAPLLAASRSGSLDAAFTLSGTPDSGMVLRSGIRLPEAETFLSSLQTVINVLPDGRFHATPINVGNYRGISIRTDNPLNAGLELQVPVQMHLAATGSWLWIACGGELAIDALNELVARSEAGLPQSTRSYPLHVSLQLSRWLGQSGDEYSAVPQQSLAELERWLSEVTKPRMTFMSMKVNGKDVKLGNASTSEFKSYGEQLLKPDRSDVDIKVSSFGRELTLDAEVGVGVIYFAAAQYVAAQSNMFKNMPFTLKTSGEGGVQRSEIRIGN
jgi:hypothetical protein